MIGNIRHYIIFIVNAWEVWGNFQLEVDGECLNSQVKGIGPKINIYWNMIWKKSR